MHRFALLLGAFSIPVAVAQQAGAQNPVLLNPALTYAYDAASCDYAAFGVRCFSVASGSHCKFTGKERAPQRQRRFLAAQTA